MVNYMGIRLDPRLTFWGQIRLVATNAAKVTSLLSGQYWWIYTGQKQIDYDNNGLYSALRQ